MADNTKVNDIEWLYPDLLSAEGLVFILKQRYIRHPTSDLESLPKEELVELYNHYVLPLPQRKYRDNRRGKEMTRKQMLIDRKAKRKTQEDNTFDHSGAKKSRTEGPSSGLINHFSQSSGSPTTRMKPPPSAVNFEKKVVKLNTSRQGTEAAGDATKHADICRHPEKRKHCSENGVGESAKDIIGDPTKRKIAKITWP